MSGAASGPARAALPDWLIIGAPKCGTTSLASWLRSHPDAFVSARKELSFFDAGWDKGIDWYAEQFAPRRSGQKAGEATPTYLYSDIALDRIRDWLPDVRLVLLLREPVERIWSQNWFLRTIGVDPRSLQMAIRQERRTGKPGFGLPVGYLESSAYAGRVRALRERFAPDQLMVAFFEQLKTDSAGLWQQVCRHIGLDPASAAPDTTRPVNPGHAPMSSWLQWATSQVWQRGAPDKPIRAIRAWNARRDYPSIPPTLRAELRAHFRPDLEELARLLDQPLPPGWLDG